MTVPDSDIFVRVGTRDKIEPLGKSWMDQLQKAHPDVDCGYTVSHYSVSDMRNRIVAAFIESGRQWLVMVDDDAYPKRGTIHDLCIPGKDIVAATVFVFAADVMLTTAKARNWKTSGLRSMGLDPDKDHGLLEVAAIGSAAMAIHRRVLTHPQMNGPFFFQTDTQGRINKGSDLCFCERAGELGFRTWWHRDVIFQHATECWTADLADIYGRFDVIRKKCNTAFGWDLSKVYLWLQDCLDELIETNPDVNDKIEQMLHDAAEIPEDAA